MRSIGGPNRYRSRTVSQRNFIRHVVFFSAKDPKDIPAIVAGLWKLADIPYSTTFEICENTRVDALSGDVDVVVYAEFPDAEALAAYKAHPIYQEAIDIVRPLRDMRVPADF
nr:Dabb family protein [Sulfitobacter maritimus]